MTDQPLLVIVGGTVDDNVEIGIRRYHRPTLHRPRLKNGIKKCPLHFTISLNSSGNRRWIWAKVRLSTFPNQKCSYRKFIIFQFRFFLIMFFSTAFDITLVVTLFALLLLLLFWWWCPRAVGHLLDSFLLCACCCYCCCCCRCCCCCCCCCCVYCCRRRCCSILIFCCLLLFFFTFLFLGVCTHMYDFLETSVLFLFLFFCLS